MLYNTQRFIVHFRGGSVDMDNSTIFYDSETKNWLFFHHDDLVAAENFAARTHGLTRCNAF